MKVEVINMWHNGKSLDYISSFTGLDGLEIMEILENKNEI